MLEQTRVLFDRYCEQQATLNGVNPKVVLDGKKFTVDPSVAQKINTRMQESSAFLAKINVMQVTELKGEALGLGIGGTLASRTNTAGGGTRATQDPTSFVADDYECKQTNSDTHLTYAKLDAWAKFPDFQSRISGLIVQRQALDRITIGFNGTSAAAATDRVANPLLQDVNIGWLQKLRAYTTAARVMAEGDVEDDKIIIAEGDAGDYANLDAVVFDMIHNLLPSWAQEDGGLVAMVSRDLLHDKYFPLVNQNLQPTETQAADLIIAAKRIGGLPAVRVPYFPTGTILVTRYDNLSIYEQEGKRRRTIVDRAEKDMVQTYESSNDAYVVESFDFACLAENIQIGPSA